jgi:HEAT repeat protein
VVIEILRNPDDQVAWQAAHLLGELEAEPALAVPALAEAVQGTNALLASAAAWALGRFGEQARPSIPALRKALARTFHRAG